MKKVGFFWSMWGAVGEGLHGVMVVFATADVVQGECGVCPYAWLWMGMVAPCPGLLGDASHQSAVSIPCQSPSSRPSSWQTAADWDLLSAGSHPDGTSQQR